MSRKGMGTLSAAGGFSAAGHCNPRMGRGEEVTTTAGSCNISSLAGFQLLISSNQA